MSKPFGWNTIGRLWYWIAHSLYKRGIVSGYSIYPYRVYDYEKPQFTTNHEKEEE